MEASVARKAALQEEKEARAIEAIATKAEATTTKKIHFRDDTCLSQ